MSDAAAIAHVTKETIRNLCKRGAIGYETHGKFFYKLELQEQMEQLRLAKTDAQTQLDALKLYPHRIKHIQELLCALIPHLDTTLSPRQVEVIMEMLQGGKWPDVSAKLGLTRDRAVQIFEKALEKLEAMPDELERKNMIIEELKEEIHNLKEMKEEKQRLENLTPEEKELLLTPGESYSGREGVTPYPD